MNRKMNTSRRNFIASTSAVMAGLTIVPSNVISGNGHTAPSDKLNIAGIGIGGKGRTNLRNMKSENIVALCDIDQNYAAKTFNDYPDAKRFVDFRKMLDEFGKSFDAVVIATPDHTHAVTAMAAMQMGKHVYVQKPLTHTVHESRVLLEASRKYKVVTQMGNEGHSSDSVAEVCEWIWSGAIGEIRHVDAWTDRPIWPQGIMRPTEVMTIPESIDWELFIGPAPMRPYNSAYHPFSWRGWWDFGTGALGDMACHVLDVIVAGLKPGNPLTLEASSTAINTESAPQSSLIHYNFPERQKIGETAMPAFSVNWYDGGLLPERPEGLADGEEMGTGRNGVIFHGSKGKLICGNYGEKYKLLPVDKFKDMPKPPQSVRRIPVSHEMDWVRACKESAEGRVLPASNFEYACPLNEMVVMGNLAVRLQSLQRKLQWDDKNMRISNISDNEKIRITNGVPGSGPKMVEFNARQASEEYIKTTYRTGWSI
jgi:predicted dehydrogenase